MKNSLLEPVSELSDYLDDFEVDQMHYYDLQDEQNESPELNKWELIDAYIDQVIKDLKDEYDRFLSLSEQYEENCGR